MRKTVQRALLLILAGAAFGLVGNQLSPRGIALVTPPKKIPQADEFLPLEKARELWSSGSAIFLDARAPEDFAVGHIGNALNLPALAFDQHYGEVAPLLSPENPVVIYCDGQECELSHRLAETLKQQGITNVHVLFNGMTAWRAAGLPTQQGGAK